MSAQASQPQQTPLEKLKSFDKRGPRTVVIHRDSGGFGFTLRHFIVYPPDSIKNQLAENQSDKIPSKISLSYKIDDFYQPWQSNSTDAMDTIFVREVKEGSSAHEAGLVTGDRIITINNQTVTGKSYGEVIDLIQNSGNTLHLLVVPKEDDILQLYFSGSAYQPVDRPYETPEYRSLPTSLYQGSPAERQRTSSASFNNTTNSSEPIYAKVNKAKKTNRVQSDSVLVTKQLDINKTNYVKPLNYQQQSGSGARKSSVKDISDLRGGTPSYSTNSTSSPLSDTFHPSEILEEVNKPFQHFNNSTVPPPPPRSIHSSVSSDVFYDNDVLAENGSSAPINPAATTTRYPQQQRDGITNAIVARPHRFQDTFSKLLIDMWYPHKSPRRHHTQSLSSYDSINQQQHHNHQQQQQPQPYFLPDYTKQSIRMSSDSVNDQHHPHHHRHKPGFGSLLTKTMKAFIPGQDSHRHHHHHHHHLDDHAGSDPEMFAEASHSWHQDKHHHHPNGQSSRMTRSEPNGYGNAKSEERLGSLEEDVHDNQNGAVNLVAQRLHQFESGSINDKAQERTNMYKHEFARVSTPSPCQIVSQRAAQFERIGSPGNSPGMDNSVLSLQSYPPSKAQLKNYVQMQRSSDSANGYSLENQFIDETCSPLSGVCHYESDSATSPSYRGRQNHVPGVIYRKKHMTDKDRHVARRISYLKATAGERMLVESDLSEDDEKAAAKRLPVAANESREHRIEKLKSFFGEKTPKIQQAIHLPENIEEPEEHKGIQGWLICKMVWSEGKRSADRSWRTVWAVFKGTCLHLFRDKKETSEHNSELYDTVINLKTTFGSIAHDYTKRKNVLRLRLANGTEYLFQADNQNNMLDWLRALRSVGLETEKELLWHHASVLEKAAAYEQQIGTIQTTTSANGNNGRVSPPLPSRQGVRLPFRHRSPTGQPPTVKTRRASHGDELGQGPKLGNAIKSRVVPGWKKMHSLQAEVLPKGASIGVRLEDCPPASENEYVPLVVELCVRIVEANGLELVGVYRVPGNNAAVSLLMDTVNQGFQQSNLQDQRWNDVNVVSSLLKAFFRKLPEPLLTSHLYNKFINASKIDEPDQRLSALKSLVHQLPRHHFETLNYLIRHLKKVVDHSDVNKMESRNLAIVFGPTLVRPSDSSMLSLVTDMSHQCYIIETMINFSEWLFSDKFPDDGKYLKDLSSARRMSHPLPITHSEALLRNVQKMDNAQFGKNRDSFSRDFLSTMAVASRKSANPTRKDHQKLPRPVGYFSKGSDSDSEPCSPFGLPSGGHKLMEQHDNDNDTAPPSPSKDFPDEVSVSSYGSGRERSRQRNTVNRMSIEEEDIAEMENERKDSGHSQTDEPVEERLIGDEVVHHTYDKIKTSTQERIKKFEKETKALLRRDMNQRHHSTSQSRVEWEQIEKEWEKAKRELEQEDLLDYVADDPSFLTYLLNRKQHNSDSVSEGVAATSSNSSSNVASASRVETDNVHSDDELDSISSSIENTLSLNLKKGDQSTKSYNSSSPVQLRNVKPSNSPSTGSIHNQRRYSYACDLAPPIKPTTSPLLFGVPKPYASASLSYYPSGSMEKPKMAKMGISACTPSASASKTYSKGNSFSSSGNSTVVAGTPSSSTTSLPLYHGDSARTPSLHAFSGSSVSSAAIPPMPSSYSTHSGNIFTTSEGQIFDRSNLLPSTNAKAEFLLSSHNSPRVTGEQPWDRSSFIRLDSNEDKNRHIPPLPLALSQYPSSSSSSSSRIGAAVRPYQINNTKPNES